MPTDKEEQPKIAVLENEPEREQIDLEATSGAVEDIKRGSKTVIIVATLFSSVLCCGMIPTGYMLFWPTATQQGGSLAVLPFVTQGSETDEVGDALTEDVIVGLKDNPHLTVTPFAQAATFRNDKRSYDVLGQELGVSYIVGGQVVLGGDRVRVQMTLVDADRGGALYEGTFSEATDAVDKLDEQIIEQLLIHLNAQ